MSGKDNDRIREPLLRNEPAPEMSLILLLLKKESCDRLDEVIPFNWLSRRLAEDGMRWLCPAFRGLPSNPKLEDMGSLNAEIVLIVFPELSKDPLAVIGGAKGRSKATSMGGAARIPASGVARASIACFETPCIPFPTDMALPIAPW